MSPLSEQRALELLAKWSQDTSWSGYLWEHVEGIEWSGDRQADDLFPESNYEVVFDPHAPVTARILAARHFGRDDAPLGYLLTRQELLDMSRQSWVKDSDFYIIGSSEELCALRTHEDPDSDLGFWIRKTDA